MRLGFEYVVFQGDFATSSCSAFRPAFKSYSYVKIPDYDFLSRLAHATSSSSSPKPSTDTLYPPFASQHRYNNDSSTASILHPANANEGRVPGSSMHLSLNSPRFQRSSAVPNKTCSRASERTGRERRKDWVLSSNEPLAPKPHLFSSHPHISYNHDSLSTHRVLSTFCNPTSHIDLSHMKNNKTFPASLSQPPFLGPIPHPARPSRRPRPRY